MNEGTKDSGGPPERNPNDSYWVESPITLPEDPDLRVDWQEIEDLRIADPAENSAYQFSLWEMFLVLTAASVLLGVLGLLPGGYRPQVFAGLAGLGLLLSLIVLSVVEPKRPIVHLLWWAMLGFYVVASLVALAWRR